MKNVQPNSRQQLVSIRHCLATRYVAIQYIGLSSSWYSGTCGTSHYLVSILYS